MKMTILVLVVQLMMMMNVKAQDNPSTQDAVSNFQPSLAVVIGILSIMFSLTFLLLLYAKFCRRPSSSAAAAVHNLQIHDGLMRSRSRFSGIDKTVVESLPFFRFSSLKGARDGLECAVCLSRFEDVEILRLLPKCKHAFHIACIDRWLENHSSCPLCRQKISPEDLSTLQYSNSLRFLLNSSNDDDDHNLQPEPNLELYVDREEDSRSGSSRFSVFSSFRRSRNKNNNNNVLHKVNHRINIVSDVVFKNRWSNVSSSDLMFLSSEMISDSTNARFSSLNRNIDAADVIKEEIERKRQFEIKINNQNYSSSSEPRNDDQKESSGKLMNQDDKRSMSEIVIHPRFSDFSFNNKESSDSAENVDENVRDERRRNAWIPIARRTVEWFANRERRTSTDHNSPETRQSFNV